MSMTTSTRTETSPILRIAGLAALIVFGIAVMTVSARVQVPFYPVPMTFQTAAVMVFALACGPRVAATIMCGYLLAGAAGLPVFAGTPERGIGLAYMMGPTGGYLFSYPLAAALMGYLAAGSGTLFRVLAMIAGLALIYTMGAGWLAFVTGSLERAVMAGVAPFVLGDLLKVGVVAIGAALVSARLKRVKPE